MGIISASGLDRHFLLLPCSAARATMPLALEILYEDNHLLAVNKPAGLPTMGTPGGSPTLLTVAKDYIKQKYDKPGNVYLGGVSRLDAPVTGVVLLARTSKAAARLAEQFREQLVEKVYWALVEGTVVPDAGTYIDWLAQDERHRRMHIVGRSFPGAKEARLSYRRVSMVKAQHLAADSRKTRTARQTIASACDQFSLLEVELQTGRKHQIRLQLSHHGHSVVGDRKYGSRWPFPDGIALHARRLVVVHPVRPERLVLQAPLPPDWRKFDVYD
jgi:23S rRNA pseudouridine1911/1915/1917 synthase